MENIMQYMNMQSLVTENLGLKISFLMSVATMTISC